MSIFDNCVLLGTVQLEILLFIKLYKNEEFCFTFFKAMLLAHRILHCCFLGERHMSLTECLRSGIDMGEKYLSRLVLRDFLLVPRKEGFLDVDIH